MGSWAKRLNRAWWTGLVVLAAFAVAAVVTWRVQVSSRDQQQQIRERAVVSQLTQSVDGVLTHERELADLLGVLHFPIGARWPVLTQPVFNAPATAGVGFVGIVKTDQVAAWEAAHHTSIVAATAPGVFTAASPRGQHWVLEQFRNHRGVVPGHIGLDLGADPVRRGLLTRAARTGAPVASPPMRLLSQSRPGSAVLVFAPVRTATGVLRGWVLASYQPARLAAAALAAAPGARITIHDGDRTLIGGRLRSGELTHAMPVAGRVWTVGAWVPPASGSIVPWLVLLLGAVIAVAIGVVVRMSASRERYALELVEHHISIEREVRDEMEAAMIQLRDNEHRLTETQALAHLGSWELDAHSGHLIWSPELCVIAGQPEGYSPTYEQFLAQVYPDDRRQLDAAVRDAQQLRPSTSEYRIIRPGGEIRWVRTSRFSDLDPDGTVRLRGATQDITDAKQAELDLHRAREHSEAITVAIAEGYGLTIDGRISRVNPSLCEMTGFSEDELVGAEVPFPFWPPEQLTENLERRDRIMARGGGTFEMTLMRKDGSCFPAELTARPAHNPDGSVLGFVTTIRDITALKRREREDRAGRELAQLVAKGARPDAVFDRVAYHLLELFDCHTGVVIRFDRDRRRGVFVTAVSADGRTLAGAELDLRGRSAPAEVFYTGAPARSNGAPSVGVDPTVDFIGEITDSVAAPITVNGQIWGCVGAAFSDGAAPADAEQRLERFADLVAMAIANTEAWDTLARQAATDSLTGLANHRTFEIRLRAEVNRAARYGRELSLVLLDVDHFKSINDTHGHQAGDQVLKQLTGLLSEHARDGDLIARTGGEEFAWLMPETDRMAALAAIERMRIAAEETYFIDVGSLTFSAGVCAYELGLDGDELYRFADRALYAAKNAGRNRSLLYGVAAEQSAAEDLSDSEDQAASSVAAR